MLGLALGRDVAVIGCGSVVVSTGLQVAAMGRKRWSAYEFNDTAVSNTDNGR